MYLYVLLTLLKYFPMKSCYYHCDLSKKDQRVPTISNTLKLQLPRHLTGFADP